MNEYTDLLCRLVECRPVSSDVTAVNRAETMMLDFLEAHGICCEMEEWEGRKVLYASTRPGRVQCCGYEGLFFHDAVRYSGKRILQSGKLFFRRSVSSVFPGFRAEPRASTLNPSEVHQSANTLPRFTTGHF